MRKIKVYINFWLVILFCIFITGCAGVERMPPSPPSTQNLSEEETLFKDIVLTEFIVGPGDEVEITVWRQPDLKNTVKITPAGRLLYPPLEEIQATGLSIIELRDKIREGLLKYYVDPKIGVRVVSVRSQKVFVLGEVNRPGVYQIDESMDVVEAISQAGGFTIDAKKENVVLIRGDLNKPTLRSLNVAKFFKQGDISQNIILTRGDILFVPACTISNLSRFFQRFYNIVAPIVEMERGIVLEPTVEDVFKGDYEKTNIIIPR